MDIHVPWSWLLNREVPMTVIPFERFQLTDHDTSSIIARCYSLIAKGIAEGWERLVSDEGEEAICILGARDGYGIYTVGRARSGRYYVRSEEHPSELQSLMRISYAV